MEEVIREVTALTLALTAHELNPVRSGAIVLSQASACAFRTKFLFLWQNTKNAGQTYVMRGSGVAGPKGLRTASVRTSIFVMFRDDTPLPESEGYWRYWRSQYGADARALEVGMTSFLHCLCVVVCGGLCGGVSDSVMFRDDTPLPESEGYWRYWRSQYGADARALEVGMGSLIVCCAARWREFFGSVLKSPPSPRLFTLASLLSRSSSYPNHIAQFWRLVCDLPSALS